MNQKPQRRGLGRGLGSLIPTAPPPPSTAERGPWSESPADTAAAANEVRWEGAAPEGPAGAAPSDGAPAGVAPVEPRPDEAGPDEAGLNESGPVLREVDGAYFAELPVTAIRPNPRQPRQVFEEEAMAELVHSVKEIGLLQPVVVRKSGVDAYELIMGERRWRATQQAGLDTIPAIVRDTGDDALLRDALLENLHRAQLNPLEEAAAYQQLLDDFGCTHEELAGRIGRSRPQISNTLRLLKLSPPVQRRVAAGVLSAGHARALLAVDDSQVQDRLAGRVVAEGISVRGLEEIVAVGDLGSDPKARTRRAKPTAPALADLAARLSDRFETRVKVDLGRTKGRITVEFASIPDLERIVTIMDPRNRDDRPI